MSLSIGIDLCDDYTTFRKDSGQEASVIPTVICREKKSEEWHAGDEAFRTALGGRGVLTDKLLKLLRKNGTSTVSGRKYTAVELLGEFLRKVLSDQLSEAERDDIANVVIAVHEPEKELLDRIGEAALLAGLPAGCVSFVSHSEAFAHFVLMQQKDLYSNSAACFDLSDETLSYYELRVIRGLSTNTVVVEKKDIEEAFHIDILRSESGRKLGDGIMYEAAVSNMGQKIFSSVFLTGKGFLKLDWAEEFKNFICRRRRVLAEQGVFAIGAMKAARDLTAGEKLPYLLFCDTRLLSDISMGVITGSRESRLILASAGERWYGLRVHAEFFPLSMEDLVIDIDPVDRFAKKKSIRTSLKDFPRRPDRCTRIRMDLELTAADCLRVTYSDMGFGEIFPATGASITEEVKI